MPNESKTKGRQLREFFEWRQEMRRKHRTMTWGEYNVWLVVGDIVSHPSSGNALAGGLTIRLNTSPVVGHIDGWVGPPRLDNTST